MVYDKGKAFYKCLMVMMMMMVVTSLKVLKGKLLSLLKGELG